MSEHNETDGQSVRIAGCAGFAKGDSYVLYDRDNQSAWIQSDASVDPSTMR